MEDPTPNYATSLDGTKIAYWSIGHGPTVILVAGAFNDHNTGADLVRKLSEDFRVVTFDRRGRGASGDHPRYAVSKEIEDLSAVAEANGGAVAAVGFSSGAALIMRAASAGISMKNLVLVDTPWMLTDSRSRPSVALAGRLRSLVESGKPGEAVEMFQRDYVGLPEEMIEKMRSAPFRPSLEAMALTTSYDAEIMGDLTVPSRITENVKQPTLLLFGEHSPPFMRETAETVASKLARGASQVVPGGGHNLTAELAPVIGKFLEANIS